MALRLFALGRYRRERQTSWFAATRLTDLFNRIEISFDTPYSRSAISIAFRLCVMMMDCRETNERRRACGRIRCGRKPSIDRDCFGKAATTGQRSVTNTSGRIAVWPMGVCDEAGSS
jgi:hypothetical protein